MTNETESEVQNSENAGVHIPHQQSVNGVNSHTNDEPRGRVSISQSAIEADNEKQKRKTSILSSRSIDNANNCYINPTFQSCSTGTSIFQPFAERPLLFISFQSCIYQPIKSIFRVCWVR